MSQSQDHHSFHAIMIVPSCVPNEINAAFAAEPCANQPRYTISLSNISYS